MQVDKIILIGSEPHNKNWYNIVSAFRSSSIDNLEIFEAVDLEKAELCEWPLADSNKSKFPNDTPESFFKQQKVNKLSHYYAIKLAKESNYKSVMILEDNLLIDKEKIQLIITALKKP